MAEKNSLSQFLEIISATPMRTDKQTGTEDFGCNEQWAVSSLTPTACACPLGVPSASSQRPEVCAEILHPHRVRAMRAAGWAQTWNSRRPWPKHTLVSDPSLNVGLFHSLRGPWDTYFPRQGLWFLAASPSRLDAFKHPAPRSFSSSIKPERLEGGPMQPAS